MAHWVKAPAADPNSLSLLCETHLGKSQNQSYMLPPDFHMQNVIYKVLWVFFLSALESYYDFSIYPFFFKKLHLKCIFCGDGTDMLQYL